MTKNAITIGGIITLFGAIAFMIWFMGLMSDVSNNPSDPKNVENVANKMVDEATPLEVNLFVIFASLGGFGAVFIILWAIFKDKIMNYGIPLSY